MPKIPIVPSIIFTNVSEVYYFEHSETSFVIVNSEFDIINLYENFPMNFIYYCENSLEELMIYAKINNTVYCFFCQELPAKYRYQQNQKYLYFTRFYY